MLKPKRVILWFRQDLRLHDNEALQEAIRYADEIIPLYVFDDRIFHSNLSFGFKKTGYHRTKFIIESVQDLRKSLRERSGELYVRQGRTEDIIYDLAQELDVNYVYCNRERTRDEVAIQDSLEKKMWSIGREVRYFRGKMLLYTADLPFPVTHCPDQFSSFKKEVDRIVPIRQPLEISDNIGEYVCEYVDPGSIPDFNEFFPEKNGQHEAAVKGGESFALEKLRLYIEENTLGDSQLEKSLTVDQGSMLSPYLAQGCLSPKLIYHKIIPNSKKSGSTLFLNLLYRDFLRFVAKKYGNKIFRYKGIAGKIKSEPSEDRNLFRLWSEGQTGIPIVDASMMQLNATGSMSQISRLLCAKFLIKNLKLNWQMGAEYFESKLLDYDPCSNWVNWNMLAGIGPDSKTERTFNIVSQARKYDPQGKFVKYWIPVLEDIPYKFIHQPHLWSTLSHASEFILSENDYPESILNN